eukprot:CAMPEP_0201888380 /NCGR_PEP_ID=MMETSP0902-20130614/27459_1 /ASSEMBLY_ACC=CAM_ASM_000551 /TAXON_ID=420261 /ORGANISM="Thalassiosira antarctica, Strain CCMP982" /LENGTH=57 /DNA_ID=CAMNT_0048418613 /DNA_START=226 /DNA_END=396 /DNA_ORIENTATION=-
MEEKANLIRADVQIRGDHQPTRQVDTFAHHQFKEDALLETFISRSFQQRTNCAIGHL